MRAIRTAARTAHMETARMKICKHTNQWFGTIIIRQHMVEKWKVTCVE